MKRPRVWASAGLLALAGTLILTGQTATGAASSSTWTDTTALAATRIPVTVTLPLETIATPGQTRGKTGSNGILRIQVGQSRPIRVMVDTGIIGLHLWGEPPPGARVSDRSHSVRLSGRKVTGVIARAPLTLGGVTTTSAQEFALISTENSYIKRWKARGVMGIIGLGVGSGNLTNPLMSMPGELARGWSIHFGRGNGRTLSDPGRLVLGAIPPTDASMHFTLPSVGVDTAGSRVWNDRAANGCWAFTNVLDRCVPTWFDSGFTEMRVTGRSFTRLPVTSTNRLKTGVSVQLAAGGSAFYGYRFRSGTRSSRNLVRVIPRGNSVINTGNAIYFDFTVTYRVDTGDIYLSRKGQS